MAPQPSSGGGIDFRKKWDKEEYEEKAKKRDLEEKDRMQENEERMRKGTSLTTISHKPWKYLPTLAGKRPRKARKDDLPKPTELMKQREGSLELDKHLNKTMVVQNPGGRGPDEPGFLV